jgi:hypothetical protein
LADFNPILNSFNAGEFSPRMKARTDLEKYASGAETIENFIIQREGGLIRRSGTRYVAPLDDMTKKSILIPFIFSTDDAYAIEFSENLIRFYTNEAILMDEEETPAIVEVVSTYTEAELFDLRFTQSGDFLYIAHPNHHPATLKRNSAYDWDLDPVAFEAGPWQEHNRDENYNLRHNKADGVDVNIDASESTFTAYDDDDEGRMLWLARNFDGTPPTNDSWGWGKCVTYTAVDDAVFNVDEAHKFKGGATTWYNNWILGAFSADPAIGYPASTGFFEGRLCWAGTAAQPDTFWGSETGIFESHRPSAIRDRTVLDSHSVNYTLAADQMNRIVWMHPMSAMILGTGSSIHRIGGSGTDVGLSPSSVLARVITNAGTGPVAPVFVGDTLCYVTKFGNEMHGILDQNGAFSASNLTLLAEHVLKSPVTQLSYAPTPGSVVYAVRTDGELATCTLVSDQNVFGWSRQILGGSFGSGNAVVESVCTIPSPNEDHDQTWVIVKRTINSATVRYVEFFEEEFADGADLEDAYFVDCGITYDSTPTDTVTGLDHLEGELIWIFADGKGQENDVVTGGEVSLAAEASKVHVGIGYTSRLKTLNLNTDTRAGTSQGKKARVVRAVTRFHNSIQGWIGRSSSNKDLQPGRPEGEPVGAQGVLMSGDVVTGFPGDYSSEPVIYIQQEAPFPMTILGIMPEVALGQRG